MHFVDKLDKLGLLLMAGINGVTEIKIKKFAILFNSYKIPFRINFHQNLRVLALTRNSMVRLKYSWFSSKRMFEIKIHGNAKFKNWL